ncbi:hypothetical protein BDN70DRAFT_989196 [Pholiota conissans]|uniref:Uncharacterized protein n=1 Tax=Pholiota conissans TaxID=109636 RepID=A0A9P5ZCH8_9AGAR|nr:hypothetical protein BDN70DRAFT_989196 [Pholiota conissans]
MGESFVYDKGRSEMFNECVKELFAGWRGQITIKPETEKGGTIGSTSQIHHRQRSGYTLLIQEDKLEQGSGGDAYLQASRGYQLLIASYKEDSAAEDKTSTFLAMGAPMFIICVIGPMLVVAGAFYDGNACVIEPLGSPSWMLEDATGCLQSSLALALNALDAGLRELQSFQATVDEPQVIRHQPGVHRVYRSFQSLGDNLYDSSTILSQARPLSLSTRHPYFASQIAETKPVLLKMVAGAYGECVHQTLAESGYAPTLYGFYKEENLPTLYVFKYLKGGWMTLFDFKARAADVSLKTYLSDIRSALDTILDCLEHEKLVHGDMRTNNIMIQVGEGGEPVTSPTNKTKIALKVVDFDWAGKAGYVRYPPCRNNEIEDVKWPAAIGEPIKVGHDRQVVDSWWGAFVTNSKEIESIP